MLKRRRPPLILRSDFTPFVSVALLLITFFVWTTQLQRPNALGMPIPSKPYKCLYTDPLKTDAILFLLAHDRIGILHFLPGTDTATFTETVYTPTGFRRLIYRMKPPNSRLTLIIKPTREATFGTIVSLLNELKRANELPFILSDVILPDEVEILAQYSAYC